MKKKLYNDKLKSLELEKKQCEDDDCRDWINDKQDMIRTQIKKLKKKSIKHAVRGAIAGATVVNAKSIGGVVDRTLTHIPK